MASWMIHLRIADKLLDRIPGLAPIEFIMGNMAPDSGVPNEDWSVFTPSKNVSHFKTDGKHFDIPAFTAKYFTAEQQAQYSEKQYSFYLGYLTHLMADTLWINNVLTPSKEKFAAELAQDKKKCMERMKEDWYDLDFLYLKKHPGFRAFRAYLGSMGFVNTYMDIFALDAFDNRREYITSFYLQENNHLDRDYPYLTEADADAFIDTAVEEILSSLGNPHER